MAWALFFVMKFSRILGVLLVVGVAAALAWHLRPEASAAAAATGGGSTGVVVATTRVAQRDMPAWLSGLGTVRAYNTVTVRPRVNGTLDQVNFTEGQEVAAGDVLARIDPRPYQSALDQALARQRQDEALLLNAQRELERSRQLVADRAESRQILDQKESDLAQADAAVHADYASVQAAELDLEFTTVRAPIAGRTGVRLIDAGNLVSANQTTGLVVITQMRPVSVLFTLGQQYLPALRRGMAANGGPLDVEALAPDGSSLGRGKLELIDNQIDGSTGSVRLKARFENDDQALWPGQFVSTRILVETRRQAPSCRRRSCKPVSTGRSPTS